MPLNFISNSAANTAHRNLMTLDRRTSESVAKLSSGTRVLTAKDDAASMAIGAGLRANVAATRAASVNAGQAVSMLQIADGAMQMIDDMLVRLKTLSIQAGSGQLGNVERGLIDAEFQALLDEINRIAGDTEFNGNTLLNGVLGGTVDFAKSDGTNLATALSKANGISQITFDPNANVASYQIANDGTNLIVTDLATGNTSTAALPLALPGPGETKDVRFADIGLTLTLDDTFDSSATALLIDGSLATIPSVDNQLSRTNGIEKVQVRSGVDPASFTVIANGDGSVTATDQKTGLIQTITGITTPEVGTTKRLNFDKVGAVVTINEDFDATLDTSKIEARTVGVLANSLFQTNGIVSLESSAGTTGDVLMLDFDAANDTFTLTNLSSTATVKSANFQLNNVPEPGDVARIDFTIDNEVFTLTIDDTFTSLTSFSTVSAIPAASFTSTGGEVTGMQLKTVDPDLDFSEFIGSAANITVDITGANSNAATVTLALDGVGAGAFTGTVDLVQSGGTVDVTLSDGTDTIVLTLTSTITANAAVVSGGAIDASGVFNNVAVTHGRAGNTGIVTSEQSGNAGQIANMTIQRVRGDISAITSPTMTMFLNNGANPAVTDSGDAVLQIGTFESAAIDLDNTATGTQVVTLSDGNGNEIDVSFNLQSAFTADTVDITFDFTDYLEDVVSNDGSVFNPAALPNALVTVGPGRLNNVEVVSVSGSIADINASQIELSNLDTPNDVTFRIRTEDGDDFVAENVNLSVLTSNAQITLADRQGNTIRLKFDVGVAFDGTEEQATVNLTNYLKNVAVSTGAATTFGTSEFSFRIGTGAETVDEIVVSLIPVNSTALGLLDVNVATREDADQALQVVSDAITALNRARSRVGALQNRLDYASSNLAISMENTEAARSQLLDLDVAMEMTHFTSQQVLVQAGVAMLAQANQLPQNLLRLFQ